MLGLARTGSYMNNGSGDQGHTVEAIPVERVRKLLVEAGRAKPAHQD